MRQERPARLSRRLIDTKPSPRTLLMSPIAVVFVLVFGFGLSTEKPDCQMAQRSHAAAASPRAADHPGSEPLHLSWLRTLLPTFLLATSPTLFDVGNQAVCLLHGFSSPNYATSCFLITFVRQISFTLP